jgi:hypothetical protein
VVVKQGKKKNDGSGLGFMAEARKGAGDAQVHKCVKFGI